VRGFLLARVEVGGGGGGNGETNEHVWEAFESRGKLVGIKTALCTIAGVLFPEATREREALQYKVNGSSSCARWITVTKKILMFDLLTCSYALTKSGKVLAILFVIK
jgi:hypothetical protein